MVPGENGPDGIAVRRHAIKVQGNDRGTAIHQDQPMEDGIVLGRLLTLANAF